MSSTETSTFADAGQDRPQLTLSEAQSMNRIAQLAVAWCGPIMVGLFVVGSVVLAKYLPPQWHPSDSAERVARIYQDNLTSIRVGLVFTVIAYSLMAVFGVGMAAQTRRLEGHFPAWTYLQLVTMAGGTAQIVINTGMWATAAFRPGETSAEVTQLANDMGFIILLGTWPPFTIWAAAVGMAILLNKSGTEVYPRWSGYLSLWAALLFVPGGTVWFFKSGPFGWTGAICVYVPFIAFGIWVVTFSVLTMRNVRRGAVHAQTLGAA